MLNKFSNTITLSLSLPLSRIEPECIKHHPDAVLDVVSHPAFKNGAVEFPMPFSAPSLSSSKDHPSKDSVILSTEDDVEGLQIAHLPQNISNKNDRRRSLLYTPAPLSQSSSSGIGTGSKLSFREVVRLAQKKAIEFEVEQRLVTSLPSEVQVRVRNSTNMHDALVQVIRDGLMARPSDQLIECLQDLRKEVAKNNEMASDNKDLAFRILEMTSENNRLATENNGLVTQVINLQETLSAKQDEMKDLQIQTLDRLVLLQSSVKALLTQTYELHEYPIPRLFIVLPCEYSSWNPFDLLSNNFRLYFLCECGEHTKVTNSKIPHHIHIAKHQGYDIAHPKEFFQQYGPYVLTILRMLKFGITVTGVVMPALSQLIRTDAIDQASERLKALPGMIEPGMDQVISCIEKAIEDQGGAVQTFSEQLSNNEALEGADLRQLETFLKGKDANRVLGNLYRTVTTEGHVKWVCIDHYRENYKEEVSQAFRDAVRILQGLFDENTGRAHVRLYSRHQAEQFYHALERSKSVYELRITFDWRWDTTYSDFKRLRHALDNTNVGVLELDLGKSNGPSSDILHRNVRYDPIFDTMGHFSIQCVTLISTPPDFIKRSSLRYYKETFFNLRYLNIHLEHLHHDISGLKSLVAKAPNLLCLTLHEDQGHFLHIYHAIAEHQHYPIYFTQQSLCIPKPKRETNLILDAYYFLKHFFKFYGKLELRENDLDEPILHTIVEGLRAQQPRPDEPKYLPVRELKLTSVEQLSDSYVESITEILDWSRFSKITVRAREDEGRVQILNRIRWDYLRELDIIVEHQGMESRVMRTLVNSVKRQREGVSLESFILRSEDHASSSLAMPQDELLQAFLSSTSIKNLVLWIYVTFEEALSLIKSVDLPRIQSLYLSTKGLDAANVDSLLDCLQHAKQLRCIRLGSNAITNEQVQRMNAKGIQLS